jgi:cyclopropane fatty-acyl-phospholipid synthase-like methyltransferase
MNPSGKNESSAESLFKKVTVPQFETEELSLGPWTSHSIINDPKHLCFVLSRYKFCAKMLEGKETVMEIGSGDGFGLPLLAQTAKKVYAVDWDKQLIEGNSRRLKFLNNVEFIVSDFNKQSLDLKVDAICNIDVIEHIDPEKENQFMDNLVQCLNDDGFLITGTPNITASEYASPQSNELHINLKCMKTLRELNQQYFKNVFMFGMNDEVLHTGYDPMCHYIWSIGTGLK